MHNRARVRGTVDLLRGAYRQPNPSRDITSKERALGARVGAQVEVDVGAVLVGAGQAALAAQRVAGRGAQVVDHGDDAGAGVGEGCARAVRLADELPARAAGGACAGAGADAVDVLGYRGGEAGGGEEAAGGGVGLEGRRGVSGGEGRGGDGIGWGSGGEMCTWQLGEPKESPAP